MSTKRLAILGTFCLILGVLTVFNGDFKYKKNSSDVTATTLEVIATAKAAPVAAVENENRIYRLSVNASSVVSLDTEITEASVDATISMLQAALEENEQAFLFIDSPGGSVFAGTKLVSFIEGNKQAINTVCVGICASMGFHIFEAGRTRYMTDNAGLMAHPASGGLGGTVSEMKSLLGFIEEYTARLDRKAAKRASIPYAQFQQLVLQNLWTTSDRSVNMKLADKIVAVDVSEGNTSPNRVSSKLFDTALEEVKKIKKAME